MEAPRQSEGGSEVPSAPPGTAATDAPQRVIYVIGAGHSGSTITGLVLGNCTGIFFAGELARWLRYRGVPPPRLRDERRTQFWSEVREQVSADPAVMGPPSRVLERSSNLFYPRTWRRQLRLRARYRTATEQILRATAQAAGATHVVDTSHFPRRARHLQAIEGIELYLLFVARDAQSVVASYGRKDVTHKQTWGMPTVNAYLWVTYAMSLFVFWRHPRERRLFIRHETFLAEPEEVLGQILRVVGSDAEIPDLSALDTGLPFQGNRLLRTDTVSMRTTAERPLAGSRLTAVLQLPWRLLFKRLRPAAGRR